VTIDRKCPATLPNYVIAHVGFSLIAIAQIQKAGPSRLDIPPRLQPLKFTMADKIHNTTQGIVGDIRSGLHGIHGAGEALRGGAMEALDGVFHKKDGEAKDRAIYEKGVAEMSGTENRFETHQHSTGHHHDHASHGQGSHFATARAEAVDPHHTTATSHAGEGQSMGAARAAWEEKH
jgi:hypothetical protein